MFNRRPLSDEAHRQRRAGGISSVDTSAATGAQRRVRAWLWCRSAGARQDSEREEEREAHCVTSPRGVAISPISNFSATTARLKPSNHQHISTIHLST